MDILLINPPPRRVRKEDIVVPPLGLAYIASVLEAAGPMLRSWTPSPFSRLGRIPRPALKAKNRN